MKVLKLPVWSPHGGISQTLMLLLPAAGSVIFSQAAKLYLKEKTNKQTNKQTIKDTSEREKH